MEQVDRVQEMIETPQSNVEMDQKMFDIINEEAQAYFEEQKDTENVATLVQNRVYLNETR